jgi:hypothetical protein
MPSGIAGPETEVRSALCRRLSAKSNPSVGKDKVSLCLRNVALLLPTRVTSGRLLSRPAPPPSGESSKDKPRLLAVEAAIAGLLLDVDGDAGDAAAEETEGCLPFAALPARLSRMTLAAPKLILRANGDCGTLEGLPEAPVGGGPVGSSSKGLSSTEFEAEETLSARALMALKGDDWALGSVDRPRVVIDSRRCGLPFWPGIAPRLLNMSTKEERRL